MTRAGVKWSHVSGGTQEQEYVRADLVDVMISKAVVGAFRKMSLDYEITADMAALEGKPDVQTLARAISRAAQMRADTLDAAKGE